mmetsp:Transcript_12200/g.33867  ORF Transcript_12200/g.33867 Transcript_12200/m.33867 type:complete len:217 (-) Transcript_12200:1777-2427(-)
MLVFVGGLGFPAAFFSAAFFFLSAFFFAAASPSLLSAPANFSFISFILSSEIASKRTSGLSMCVLSGTSLLGYLAPSKSCASIAYEVWGSFICFKILAVVVGMKGCIKHATIRTSPTQDAMTLAHRQRVLSSFIKTHGSFSWKNWFPALEHAKISLMASRICIFSIASMYFFTRGWTASPNSSSYLFSAGSLSFFCSAASGPHMSSRDGKWPLKRA